MVSKRPGIGQRLLSGLMAFLMLLPGTVFAQPNTGAPPASSQAAETKLPGGGAEEKGTKGRASSSATQLSPKELREQAKTLEKTNPALADEIRKAVAAGELQKARELVSQKTGKSERVEGKKPTTGKRKGQGRDKGQAQEAGNIPETQEIQPERQGKSQSTLEKLFAQSALSEMQSESSSGEEGSLEQFGYDLFSGQQNTGMVSLGGMVGADYVLGPNDEFTVTLWGLPSGSLPAGSPSASAPGAAVQGGADGVFPVKVNREGNVVLPKVGEVLVAGIKYGDLKGHIERAFSRHFKNFHLSVTMGLLRGIQVFIVGEVSNPGSHTLDSLTTVVNALFASGGAKKSGTLRDIRVLRGGKVVKYLDLYEFLMKGDKSQDIRLQDQDTVFVPLIGPVAAVAGEVPRPAIYELKNGNTLEELLEFAGGVRPSGYLTRVQIERTVAHDRKIAVDLNLAVPEQGQAGAGQPADSPPPGMRARVHNMDLVRVFPISPVVQSVVYLKGHVVRPGAYEFKPGMRIKDVLKSQQDILPEVYGDYARIVRYTLPDRSKQVVPFSLKHALAGDPSANIELQNLDEIEIFSREDLKAFPSVSANGEVRQPGVFPLLKEMRVSDLIVVAGGLTTEAYQKEAELTRYMTEASKTTMNVIKVDLARAVSGDPKHNVILQERDNLSVRPMPESDVGRAVTLKGEVRFPGQYSIKRGERLSSVLKRAGGFTERAFVKGTVLIRESARQRQESEVQRFLATQKQKLSVEIAALSAGNVNPSTLGAGAISAEQSQLNFQVQALEQMAILLAPGRVVLHMTSLDSLEGTQDDVLLEPDDQITVPQQPLVVTVLGGVKNSTSVLYRDGLGLEQYIQQAGGLVADAKEKEIYVVKADGSTESGVPWRIKIEAGDSIVVPLDIDPKARPLQLWTAVASILGSLMLGAAAIAVIGR